MRVSRNVPSSSLIPARTASARERNAPAATAESSRRNSSSVKRTAICDMQKAYQEGDAHGFPCRRPAGAARWPKQLGGALAWDVAVDQRHDHEGKDADVDLGRAERGVLGSDDQI